MAKKTLFSILSAVLILPSLVHAEGGVDTIATAVQTAAINIGGPLIIIGWIIAGVLYLTSAGSPERTGVAKKALIAAVIGTALVLVSNGAAGLVKSTFGI